MLYASNPKLSLLLLLLTQLSRQGIPVRNDHARTHMHHKVSLSLLRLL